MGGRLRAGLGSEGLTTTDIETRVARFAAMGTRVELHVFGVGDPDALAHAQAAIEAVDDALTIHRPSPTTALNERLAEGRDAVITDPVLLEALGEIGGLVTLTGGMFDPTADIARSQGWSGVALDLAASRVAASHPLAVDFGGFGKGFALDRAARALRDAGVVSAFLSAGESSIAVVGRHPMGVRWPVGIPDPLAPDRFLIELELEDEALSVSSTMGVAGRSPTVRPDTGQAMTAPRTAIAVARSGAEAEAMSTALLIASEAERERLTSDAPDRRFVFCFADGAATPLIANEDSR